MDGLNFRGRWDDIKSGILSTIKRTVPRKNTLNSFGLASSAIQPVENSTSGVKMPTSIASNTNGPMIFNNRHPVTI